MNEQELNKKLATLAGFNPEYNQNLGEWRWEAPDGEWDIDFTVSIDACFKWLIPKVSPDLESFTALLRSWVEMIKAGYERKLALCLAIEKLIEDKD